MALSYLTLLLPLISSISGQELPKAEIPKLSGYHFRITTIEYEGYCDIQEQGNGELSFSGYTIDILKELSIRANFTYDLLTPSGFGSLCEPRLPRTNLSHELHHPEAYHSRYRQSFRCGESDVNDRPVSNYSTDMYWGGFYVTPERLLVSQFTLPFAPPAQATFGMMGTATHIQHIRDLETTNYNVCSYSGTSNLPTLRLSFPHLDIQGIFYGDEHARLSDGTCHVIIDGMPFLKQTILRLYKEGKCTANGKPIGIIGEPLEYGLGQLSFGLRSDLHPEVAQALNFWLQALMACFPEDPNGHCPNGIGSISQMYVNRGGRGDECGYVQFPQEPTAKGLPTGAIVAIAVTPVVLVLAVGMIWHARQLKLQEKRMKKRFIQQLARNIEIGPSARQISAAKLSETFQHIGGKDGLISKEDLAKWMNDLNLDFLSEQDFDRLWHTMDMDGTGSVDPIEFYTFLTECEKQFQEVHEEFDALPKLEKIKLAARRLSNIKLLGQEGVEKLERRNNQRGRQCLITPPSSREMTDSMKESRHTANEGMMDLSCGSNG